MTQPVRSVRAKLEADASGYKRALVDATKVTADLANEVNRVGSLATQKGAEVAKAAHEQELAHQRTLVAAERLGRGMLIVGAGIAAGIGLATRAAINWESSWAGVVKTVDGSTEQLAMLEDELRSMARELPASHEQIAAVAEAAGQLGIKVDDVADFTRTMIDMGEATNLSAEEAAFSIAQMVNVMGTSVDDVDRLASAVVDLGNNSATTEADIVAMAQRIAGAGSTIGLTETEVLGFAAALSSVGVNAEAGGSAISRAMIRIEQAVRAGGDELETLAEVAGMSASQFQAAYERDAAQAIATFVAGLGRMQASGEDVFATLDRLGFTEIRLRDALLRLASSGDLLTRSLDTSAAAWDENIALQEEAERRYGTTAAQMSIAKNQVNDFAITMGETFLPVVGDAASTIGTLADVLGDLPGPIQTAVGVAAALAAGVLLLGGGMLLVVPRVVAFKQALDQVAASGGRAAAAVGGFRAATSFMLGPWGLAIAAAVAVATAAFSAWSINQAEARMEAKEFADTLDEVTGAFTDATRALVAHRLEESGALEAAQKLGLSLAEVTDIVLSEGDAIGQLQQAVADADNAFVMMDGTLVGLGSRITDEQQNAWTNLSGAIGDTSGQLADGVEQWQRTQEAQEGTLDVTSQLDPAVRDLASSFDVSAMAASDVADAVDDLDEELKQLFDRVFGLQNAQDDLADAFDKLTDQIETQKDAGVEGAGSLRGMTEAARDNRDAAQELLEKYGQLTLETIKQSGSAEEAAGVAEDFESALDELERQTGLNVREMEGYNDVVAEIERLIKVTFNTPGVKDAITEAERLKARLDNIDRFINIHFTTSGQRPSGSFQVPERHGGIVMHAQTGLLRTANIFPPVAPARFAFAEPATGGEAFIPRIGDRARSLAIADVAAQWHGGRVVAADSAAPGVGGRWQWHGQRSPTAGGDGAALSGTASFTTNVYPQRADFTIQDLDALQRRQDALARVNRPH